jgi:hypothetical protein
MALPSPGAGEESGYEAQAVAQGRELGASASLCGKPLHMSTAITGHNGARLKPTVKVAVAGCKHKKKRHPKKRPHPAHRKR